MTHKKVKLSLEGIDGNAFVIMGRVTKAMKKAGWTEAEIDEYRTKAKYGDYDNLLRVTMDYIEEPDEEDEDL